MTFYQDNDGDGYGDAGVTAQACSAPAGYVTNSADCNDNNANVNPGEAEVCNECGRVKVRIKNEEVVARCVNCS